MLFMCAVPLYMCRRPYWWLQGNKHMYMINASYLRGNLLCGI
jgi:hypothetical protein